MALPYAWFNGNIVPVTDAAVSVTTPAYRYGASVFEGLRAYWNDDEKQLYVFRLNDHSVRLLESAKLSRMEHSYSLEYLNAAVLKLLTHLQVRTDVHIVQSLFVGGGGNVAAAGPVGDAIVVRERGRGPGHQDGLNCQVSSWARISDTSVPPRIKAAANYQNSRLALMQAQLDGYDSAIFLNSRGKVAEGPGDCLFMLRKGRLITPPVTADILESITRETVMQIARDDFGLQVDEADIDRTELYVADELFVVGSNAEVAAVVSVDRHPIGDGKPGSLTQRLQARYLEIVRSPQGAYSHYLTAVH